MSSITGSCSESTAQTLYNQHIQELQQARQHKLDQPGNKDPLALSGSSDESHPEQSQSSVATQKATEPGKGQFLDLYA